VPSTVQSSTSAGSSRTVANRISDSNSESAAPLTLTAYGQDENITTSPRAADPTVGSIMKAPVNSSGFVVDPGLVPSVPVSWAQVAATLNNEVPFQTVSGNVSQCWLTV
jgi:hypothetical protein